MPHMITGIPKETKVQESRVAFSLDDIHRFGQCYRMLVEIDADVRVIDRDQDDLEIRSVAEAHQKNCLEYTRPREIQTFAAGVLAKI